MNMLSRVIKLAWNEANKPGSYVKGDEFENFVRSHIFSHDSYDLLNKTHNYTINKSDYVETSKEPDFKFRSRTNGKEFFVEAKYRSIFYKGALEWCKPYQFKRYKAIDNKTPVCIALGVGGQPSAPEQVFLIPMKHIKYAKLFPSFLKGYKVSEPHCITEKQLSVLLH